MCLQPFILYFIFSVIGTFLFAFLCILVVCGLPTYFVDLVIGQFSGRTSLHAWEICPLLKGESNNVFHVNVDIVSNERFSSLNPSFSMIFILAVARCVVSTPGPIMMKCVHQKKVFARITTIRTDVYYIRYICEIHFSTLHCNYSTFMLIV